MPKKRKRPDITRSRTYEIDTHLAKVYITVGWPLRSKAILEIFMNSSSVNPCAKSEFEAVGRMVSLARAYSIPVPEIIGQLENIKCEPIWWEGEQVSSLADAAAKVLRLAMKDGPP